VPLIVRATPGSYQLAATSFPLEITMARFAAGYSTHLGAYLPQAPAW
jgi:hypothetical protein